LCVSIIAGESSRAPTSFCPYTYHNRKCGRVVCNSCSPHRIIIPHQYIVRPPGSEAAMHQSLLVDGLGAGYFDVNDMSGGERVRLCNPCVPDPNTAPPQSPGPQATLSPRVPHQRSRSTIGDAYGTLQSSNRHGAVFAPGTSGDPYRYLSPRMRSVTMVFCLCSLKLRQLLTLNFRALLHLAPLLPLPTGDVAERIRHPSSVSSQVHRLLLHLHTQSDTVH
jgi:hypothetical protein